ncbi:MAG: hypothetical protein R6U46_03470 [Marinilabilia sp.]
MNRPEIQLKKERDFSNVFNASFAFVTQEVGRLLRVVGLYAGVPIIIAVIMNAYYAQDTMSSVFNIMSSGNAMSEPDNLLTGLSILFSLLAQLFIAGLIPAYVAEYEAKGKDGFRADDVWERFVTNFGAIIGYSLLAAFMVIVGFGLLIFPGIYLWVPLSFVLYVKLIEEKSLGSVFSRCFQLIRNNWWKTFGIFVLAYLIMSIITGLFSLPAAIVAGIEGFMVGSGQQEALDANSLAVILTTVVGGLGQYLLYPVLYIILAFQYYNLREQKDRDSLMEKVSAINEEE